MHQHQQQRQLTLLLQLGAAGVRAAQMVRLVLVLLPWVVGVLPASQQTLPRLVHTECCAAMPSDLSGGGGRTVCGTSLLKQHKCVLTRTAPNQNCTKRAHAVRRRGRLHMVVQDGTVARASVTHISLKTQDVLYVFRTHVSDYRMSFLRDI